MISLDEFVNYWEGVGFAKFLRLFWYYFLVEAPRYIIMDFVVLMFYFVNKRLKRKRWAEARRQFFEERPLVSVIIPGKNEGKHIYKLARSLNEQTYKNFELIIVDDGSDDDTPIICKDLQKHGFIDLFLRNDVRGGKASAANLALRYTKGKYIIHFDADCSFNRDAIENVLVPFYYNPKIGAVGGNLEVRNTDESLATTLQTIEYMKSITTGRIVTSHLGIYAIISGAFGAFRKDILDQVNGWDIGPGLDGDITMKIRKKGYKIHFEPTATGLTSVPRNFSILAKQRLRWDKSIVRFRVRKHHDVFLPSESFRLSNFISSGENILFNVILNFHWYLYGLDIIFNYSQMLLYIFLMNQLMYSTSNYLQFFMALTVVEKPRTKLKLLLYIPLMALYNGYFLRIVRTIAHTRELLFRSSYNDPWNPPKSSNQARRLKI